MDLMHHLRNFFLEHSDQEAAIPGLGIFVYEVDEQNKALCSFYEKPPRSKAFLNYLAFSLSISEEEAAQVLAAKVKTLLKSLKENRTADFDGVGTFRIEENKVIFTPSIHQFPEESRFGLDEQAAFSSYSDEEELLQIEGSEASYDSSRKSLFKGGRLVFVIIMALVMAVLIVIASVPSFRKAVFSVFSETRAPQEVQLPTIDEDMSVLDTNFSEDTQDQDYIDTKSEDEIIAMAVIEQKKEEERIKKAEEEALAKARKTKQENKASSTPPNTSKPATKQSPATPTKTEAKIGASSTKTISPKSGHFYIIAGSFAEKANAEKLSKDFSDKSYSPEILHNSEKKLYMLSIKSFESMDDALDFKAKIRTEKGIGAWIYKQ